MKWPYTEFVASNDALDTSDNPKCRLPTKISKIDKAHEEFFLDTRYYLKYEGGRGLSGAPHLKNLIFLFSNRTGKPESKRFLIFRWKPEKYSLSAEHFAQIRSDMSTAKNLSGRPWKPYHRWCGSAPHPFIFLQATIDRRRFFIS